MGMRDIREGYLSLEKKMTKREHLPPVRKGYIHKVRIGGQKIYLHTGEYPDGRLGEIFLTASKSGTLLQALLDSFSISVSLSLQHGVPLEEYVEAFKHTKFEPSGCVSGDEGIKMASSILDWVFRELEINYLNKPAEEEETIEPMPPAKKVAGAYSTGGS